jgi:hypothetical protein
MLNLKRQHFMDLSMRHFKSIFSISLTALLVACGGGGDAACSAGLGALIGSSTNCGSNAPNSAPVAKTGLVQNIALGSVVTLDGTGSTDSNNDVLTYKWEVSALPTGSKAVLSSATAPKPTFTADVVGTYSFTLVVNDGKLSSTAVTSTVVASNSNSAPVANPGTNQNVNLGAVVYLDGSGSTDTDKDSLSYRWTLVIKPTDSAAVLLFPNSPNPKFTADKAGAYGLGLVVNDGKTDSAMGVITVTAYPANTPPVAVAGDNQNVALSTLVSLNGSGSTDANADPLTYKWALIYKPATSTASLSSTTIFNPTFTGDVPGTYVAGLVVNDGKVSSEASVTTIIVASANSVPVANAGAAQSVLTGATATLDGTGSTDANGDTLTYSWVLSAPSGSAATLSSSTESKPTFRADVTGTYVASLIVNDGKANSVVASTRVTAATANTAPVASAGSAQTVTVTATVTLDGTASTDANGDTLTYRWVLSTKPSGSSTVLLLSTTSKPTFVPDKVGVYVATLIVNDGRADSASATVPVTATATGLTGVSGS